MSSWKYAYHWHGHIFVPESGNESDPEHNAIAIPDDVFKRIADDVDNLNLPASVEAEWLGVDDARFKIGEECSFLAIGHSFTEAWKMYGTVVNETHEEDARQRSADYLSVMLSHYGVDLSNHPVRMMVGVNVEH